MGRIPIALQLCSVREECERDLEGTLATLAAMGYQGVEFNGFFGHSARSLRHMLDQAGLRAAGAHIYLEELWGNALTDIVEFNQILGNPFLIVPHLPWNLRSSRTAWLAAAGLFDELAEALAPSDIRIGYHNHHTEFIPFEGEMPWDLFFGHTSHSVVMQFDVSNALLSGLDPLPLMARYPGRAATVHLREYRWGYEQALIGEGDVDWPSLFSYCETTGGTEWCVVEQRSHSHAPLESARRSIQTLRSWGK